MLYLNSDPESRLVLYPDQNNPSAVICFHNHGSKFSVLESGNENKYSLMPEPPPHSLARPDFSCKGLASTEWLKETMCHDK